MKVLVIAKWILLSSLVGVLAGLASGVFLHSLDWVTQTRLEQPDLVWGLPFIGLLMGWSYHRFGSNAGLGNHLVIAEANERKSKIPLRMAPMVLIGTLFTHLFGGSAGREGTAVQMGASLSDTLNRVFKLKEEDHRLMIMAGISGGFGSVFGVPIAGFLFGLEVQKLGRLRYNALIPCFVASVVGDQVTHLMNAPHGTYPVLPQLNAEPVLLIKSVLAGLIFGLTSLAFIELIKIFKSVWSRMTSRKWIHPFIGAWVILTLSLWVGPQYLGLSLPLIDQAVQGDSLSFADPLLKLLFTSLTLSAGFLGGEVTPLFVIGSTMGNALAPLLSLDPGFLACLGLVAVFAGASNTPLACAVMGLELFGGGSALYLFVVCFVAYLSSGHRGIYHTQKLWVDKYDPRKGPTRQNLNPQ